jgi:hypothetical protein
VVANSSFSSVRLLTIAQWERALGPIIYANDTDNDFELGRIGRDITGERQVSMEV